MTIIRAIAPWIAIVACLILFIFLSDFLIGLANLTPFANPIDFATLIFLLAGMSGLVCTALDDRVVKWKDELSAFLGPLKILLYFYFKEAPSMKPRNLLEGARGSFLLKAFFALAKILVFGLTIAAINDLNDSTFHEAGGIAALLSLLGGAVIASLGSFAGVSVYLLVQILFPRGLSK